MEANGPSGCPPEVPCRRDQVLWSIEGRRQGSGFTHTTCPAREWSSVPTAVTQ